MQYHDLATETLSHMRTRISAVAGRKPAQFLPSKTDNQVPYHIPLPISLSRRRRILPQNPLLNQLLGLRPLLNLLLQTIRPHVFLQFPLLLLQRRCSRRVRQDVAPDQFFFLGTSFQPFAKTVSRFLALELSLGGLDCSVRERGLVEGIEEEEREKFHTGRHWCHGGCCDS